jgi:hypothetical protein
MDKKLIELETWLDAKVLRDYSTTVYGTDPYVKNSDEDIDHEYVKQYYRLSVNGVDEV